MENNLENFTSTAQTFDNTKISAYKFCPRSYFIRHVLHWRSEGTAPSLVFGLAWHDAMDAVWKGAKNLSQYELVQAAALTFNQTWEEWGFNSNPDLAEMDQMQPRTPGNAHEMLDNYVEQRYQMLTRCNLLAAEQPFAVPFPNLSNIWYVGRMDKVLEYNAQLLILEHKSTTAYAIQGSFRTDYVDSWYSAPQIKGYEFAGAMYYGGLDAVWVDAALVHKKVHDAFKFIPVAHKENLLKEWLEDTRGWIQRIIADTDSYNSCGKLVGGTFPKNEDNCYGKYGSCPFLNICRTKADPSQLDSVPYGYQEEEWKPFDVLKLGVLLNKGD